MDIQNFKNQRFSLDLLAKGSMFINILLLSLPSSSEVGNVWKLLNLFISFILAGCWMDVDTVQQPQLEQIGFLQKLLRFFFVVAVLPCSAKTLSSPESRSKDDGRFSLLMGIQFVGRDDGCVRVCSKASTLLEDSLAETIGPNV